MRTVTLSVEPLALYVFNQKPSIQKMITSFLLIFHMEKKMNLPAAF